MQFSYQYSPVPDPSAINRNLLPLPDPNGYQPAPGVDTREVLEVLDTVAIDSLFMRGPLKEVAVTRVTSPGDVEGVDIDLPVRVRLRVFSRMWTRDSWSHRTVRMGLSWSWLGKPPRFRTFFQRSDLVIRIFLKEKLETRTIEEMTFIAFQGRLFSVPKKRTVKRRVIIDISSFNKWISCPKFKITSVSQIR